MCQNVAVERKPQQQTLSIRISEGLREFLERSKQVISNGRNESVSTSDVAKILLESAKDDRLDFRVEVAGLQQSPTQSLWAIRRKWEQKHDLSRAEWIFLAQYIQVACEEIHGTHGLPSAESFATLLEAWLALRGLRGERGAGLDRYYLGNLGSDDGAVFNERQIDPDVASNLGVKLIRELRESPSAKKPEFAGRNFYVAVRDEMLPDIVALNRALLPYMAVLFRLAARGHWQRERQPVRVLREQEVVITGTNQLKAPGFVVSFQIGSDGDLVVMLSAQEKDVMYPIAPYPKVCEFLAMMEGLNPEEEWHGIYFFARTLSVGHDHRMRFYFRRMSDGVELGFSQEDWESLKQLFRDALATSWLKKALSSLSLAYGEL